MPRPCGRSGSLMAVTSSLRHRSHASRWLRYSRGVSAFTSAAAFCALSRSTRIRRTSRTSFRAFSREAAWSYSDFWPCSKPGLENPRLGFSRSASCHCNSPLLFCQKWSLQPSWTAGRYHKGPCPKAPESPTAPLAAKCGVSLPRTSYECSQKNAQANTRGYSCYKCHWFSPMAGGTGLAPVCDETLSAGPGCMPRHWPS